VEDLGGFDHRGVHKQDIFSAFMQVSPNALGDEIVMEPVEEAIVNRCSLSLHLGKKFQV